MSISDEMILALIPLCIRQQVKAPDIVLHCVKLMMMITFFAGTKNADERHKMSKSFMPWSGKQNQLEKEIQLGLTSFFDIFSGDELTNQAFFLLHSICD